MAKGARREGEEKAPGGSSSSSSSGYCGSYRGVQTSESDSSEEEESSSDWGEDEWPPDRALPLPEWGSERPELLLCDHFAFESFQERLTQKLTDSVQKFSYDTLSNFINFSSEYLSQRSDYSSLHEFYRDYDPPLLPGRYTCVGLSLSLITSVSSLEDQYPGLKDAMYQVSCEEEIDQIDPYCAMDYPPVTTCEKEHVLVCIRIKIGDRPGVVLLDPGYHLARPVIVMKDLVHPHTPEFTASTKGSITKTYSYEFHSNPAFILWKVVERKGSIETCRRFSLIHVARPFLSAIDIAERRNLVYPFKTLLHRNEKGELTAGLYFRIRTIDSTRVTVFHVDEQGRRLETPIPISFFLFDQLEDNDETAKYYKAVSELETRLTVGEAVRKALRVAAALISNESFLIEFNRLNDDVDKISRDN